MSSSVEDPVIIVTYSLSKILRTWVSIRSVRSSFIIGTNCIYAETDGLCEWELLSH